MSSLPLVWCASLRDATGYADEARTFLLALERAGSPAAAVELKWGAPSVRLAGEHERAVTRALARRVAGEAVYVEHVVPHANAAEPRLACVVARTMFETDRVPQAWVPFLLGRQEIWVPTEFNVETFARSGIPVDRLHVLPETIDFDLFDPARARPLRLEGRRGFTFLSNFDFTIRKGWDVLIEAWARAFGPDDDVCLVLKCLGFFGVSEAAVRARIDEALGGRECAPILLTMRQLSGEEMPRLYAAADAYVSASRGEGWGRPTMEAMAMGLPTIGTRFSGNLAFMDDATTFLVDGELRTITADDEAPTDFYRGHRWLEPDVDHLAETLRRVHAGERRGRAREGLLERFGPVPTAARLADLTEGALERRRELVSRPVACAWRGDWGSVHSLAVVNDGLAGALDASTRVIRAGRGAPSIDADLPGVASHWPPSFEAPSAGPFVLYQPWEFGRIPRSWVEQIRLHVDEVWTPSSYSRAAFVDSGVPEELVRVVPNGVDLVRFSPAGAARELPGDPTFLFVGGTIYRKGIDLLLDAWAEAFPEGEARLVVKTFGSDSFYRGQSADDVIRGRDGVVLLEGELEPAEVAALYRGADVLVQPYRGEGFCLPALEALACGVPVIVTAGGPTDDFVDDSCAWRVASERVPLPLGSLGSELAPAGEGHLLEPSSRELVEALRAAADPEARAVKAAAARAAAERFTWAHAGRIAAERLVALTGRKPVRRIGPAVVPDRRGFLFAADSEAWAPAVRAYAEAFGPGDDTTLIVPVPDADLVLAELAAAGIDAAQLADVALTDTGELEPAALELAADAVIGVARAGRARRVVPADPGALRALVQAA